MGVVRRIEGDVVAGGTHVGGFDTEAGLDVELGEVDGVHDVAGGNLLDGGEDVGVGCGGGLDAVDESGVVGEGVGLDEVEVGYGAVDSAEVGLVVVVVVLKSPWSWAMVGVEDPALVDQPS